MSCGSCCNHCQQNTCTVCQSNCDCVPAEVTIVRPIKKLDVCDELIETVRQLTKPTIGACDLKVTGVSNGNKVVLLASKTRGVQYSLDGGNYQNANAFLDQPCGRHVYFAKDMEGCLASVSVNIDCGCDADFIPKNPSEVFCIGGFVNTKYVNGCGDFEWRPTTQPCVPVEEYCNNALNILSPLVTCKSGNITEVVLEVTGNLGNKVEFKNPFTGIWELANGGNAKTKLTGPSNGITSVYFARMQGCTRQVQGFVNTCSPTNSYTATRSEVVNCPINCVQKTITYTKVYTGATQEIANTNASSDGMYYTEAESYAKANCVCGNFDIGVLVASCEISTSPTPTPSPTPVPSEYTNYYEIKKCVDDVTFYTTTVLSTIGQQVSDSDGTIFIFTGQVLYQATAPARFIGAVNLRSGIGCGSSGSCGIEVVSATVSYTVSVRNSTSQTLEFCYQVSGPSQIVSVLIPANSGVQSFCVEGANYIDNSGLLSVVVEGECV